MIKDDKQNHLLVISICHGTAFAISRASLKNISESSAGGGGRTEEEDGDASERGGERRGGERRPLGARGYEGQVGLTVSK